MNESEENNNIVSAKQKTDTRKKRIKFAILISTTFASLFGLAAGSFAWFLAETNNSRISAVSGDLGVNIEKVTAYKMVYPYYPSTIDLVDYEKDPTLKGYVVEDKDMLEGITSTIFDSSTTIALTRQASATSDSRAISPGAATSTKIYYEASNSYPYSLIGDGVFSGVSDNPWTSLTSVSFPSDNAVTTTEPVVLANAVVSAGAKFILFDKEGMTNSGCKYFTYGSPSGVNPRFKVVDGGTSIQCIKCGIYTFAYYSDRLTITLTPRSDESIIGGTKLDPTKIMIDYAGKADKSIYSTPESYAGTGVHLQNTMVILDVQLTYKNANPITAGLTIFRSASNANSIFRLDDRYDDTEHNVKGYVDAEHPNPLNGSDFYAFSAIFASENNKFSSLDGENGLWDTMHQLTSHKSDGVNYDFTKFANEETFDTEISCPMRAKQGDSLVVPGNDDVSGKYHCYVATEYDYEHVCYFLNKNRLGKKYLLDRDFGFKFTAVQRLEGQS